MSIALASRANEFPISRAIAENDQVHPGKADEVGVIKPDPKLISQ